MTDKLDSQEAAFLDRAERTIVTARSFVGRSVNIAMVHAYWLVGRDIVEVEQAGQARAGYGDELIEKLSTRLTARFGRGFSPRTVRRIRQFYLTYPEGSKLPAEPAELGFRTTLLAQSGARSGALFPPTLGWSHYANLLKVEDEGARAFYEIEAARGGWTVRELNRQIASLLYERLAKSRDKQDDHRRATEDSGLLQVAETRADPGPQPHRAEQRLEDDEARVRREPAVLAEPEARNLVEPGVDFCFTGFHLR